MTRWTFAAVALAPLLLAAHPVAAASGDVPTLDINGTCHVDSVGEKSAQEACMKDEQGARTELVKAWGGIPGDIRKTCTDEVHIGGSPSYVELLTCAQMNQWSKEPGHQPVQGGGIPPVKP